jgi:CDP-paratose 2-epimerase
VYNIGGGRGNSCSILEAFERVEELTGRPMKWEYVNEPRNGDHICYISNLNKLRKHYPGWDVTKTLDDIFMELVSAWEARENSFGAGRELAI